MNYDNIIGIMIIGCLIFMACIIFFKNMKLLFKLCINSVIGVSAIFIINYFFEPLGFGIGINMFTTAISAILGIPGVICLYAINIFL